MRVQRPQSRHRVAICAILTFALLDAGCSWFKRGDGLAGVAVIPLTPALRLSSSVTTAAVPYQNACGEPASSSIAGPLVEAVPKKLERVFTGVTTQTGAGQTQTSDGFIEVGLGLKQIDLAIPRQVKRTYPVTVTLGIDVAFLAEDGTLLFSKKLQSVGRGEVEVTEESCDVKGLEPVVLEAIDLVTEGMALHVAESVRVRDYAERRKVGIPAASGAPNQPRSVPPTVAVAPGASSGGAQGNGITLTENQTTAAEAAQETTALTFRATMRDENRDQILQQDESLTIEVEVKNDGVAEAKGVEVVIGGMTLLTAYFPPVLPVGDLQPGEVKRASITKRVTALQEVLRGELVLSLRNTTPVASVPPPKRFTLLIKPEKTNTVPAVPDVDRPPKPIAAFKQPKAIVIAIGVGRFRNERVPSVKYAGRDAEVMAGYLRAIGSVPGDRVRVLLDTHALKQDLADTFDKWLPKRVVAGTVVYVFFAGRALVDGVTGAVSLVPFDGSTSALDRLYSVRRLQESLARLPIHRAILMFDVSLDPSPGADLATTPRPSWETVRGDRKDQIMWMVGNKSLQEAHAYEQGRHGLFTYHLLRGLQGVADVDRDGRVVAWELCTYARGQVARTAREQFGNEQDPLCIPPPGQGAMIRIHPLAKGNNPKPVATTKNAEHAADPTPQAPQPTEVGPGR
ncbi:MAG: caspase family protein [Nitrospiraceae bacterium]